MVGKGESALLDFRIDTFLTVCKYMNYTRAAEELHITQPAVSQHIRHLEEEYGISLFEQKGKKMALTAPGKMFLDAATTMKHDDIYLKQKFMELKEEQKTLTFGATLTAGEYILSRPLAAYLNSHPKIIVHMEIDNTTQLLQKLNGGEIDFAFVEGFFPRNEYDYLVYSTESYTAVCGPDYRFQKSVHALEDLLDEPLILREAGSGTREILERFLENRNQTLQDWSRVMEVGSINAIKILTEAGCGITFLYKTAVRDELKAGRLREIPLSDFQLSHDITFIWRKNSLFSGYYRELFEELHQLRMDCP